jgi:hypothetical protein
MTHEQDEHIASMARPFFKGIENEFEHIYEEAANLKKMIEMYGSKHPDELAHAEKFMFDGARASMIGKVYSGLERILIKICIEIDEYHPKDSMTAKRDALERLSIEMDVPGPLGHRPAVISNDSKKVLNELMKFRRATRGCYTVQLVHLDLAGNAAKVLGIVPVVKAEVDRFKIDITRQEYFPGE